MKKRRRLPGARFVLDFGAMIWADRLALLIGIPWALFVWFLGGGFAPHAAAGTYFEMFLGIWGVPVGIIWLFLRIIDGMAGGASRRRGRIDARVVR